MLFYIQSGWEKKLILSFLILPHFFPILNPLIGKYFTLNSIIYTQFLTDISVIFYVSLSDVSLIFKCMLFLVLVYLICFPHTQCELQFYLFVFSDLFFFFPPKEHSLLSTLMIKAFDIYSRQRSRSSFAENNGLPTSSSSVRRVLLWYKQCLAHQEKCFVLTVSKLS